MMRPLWWASHVLGVALSLGGVACGDVESVRADSDAAADTSAPDGRSETTVPLVLVGRNWEATALDDDPFAATTARQSNQCSAWWPTDEGALLEFDTNFCAAMTVEDTLGHALPPGTRLVLTTSHAIVLADAPATGYLGLAIDDQVLVLRPVAIPGPAGAYVDEVVLPHAVNADARLRLHVSNHGANTWRFVQLLAQVPD